MFLQALLFFLLGTSVFAGALAKGSNTEVARVARDDPQHQAVVEAQKPHIGLWYPSEASVKVPRHCIIQVLPSEEIRLRRILGHNGAILEHPNDLLTPEMIINRFDSESVQYLRRFPTNSTEFKDLFHCLSLRVIKGRSVAFHFMPACASPFQQPITHWAKDLNYWYQVPDSNNPRLASAPVLQFDHKKQVVGIYYLGVDGGVDLTSMVPITGSGYKIIEGRYRRVPFPDIPQKYRRDHMEVTVKKQFWGLLTPYTPYTVTVMRGYNSIDSWHNDPDK